MLYMRSISSLLLLAATVSAACNAAERVRTSRQVVTAYNTEGLAESAEAFKLVPWGAPDSAGPCLTTITPDGLNCAITVATTGAGTYEFAVESRQVFNHVDITEATPFDNGTVLLSVDVHLGARQFVPLATSFHGYVYMDYNDDCRIYSARAFADVPTSVLDFFTAQAVGVPGGGLGEACKPLPVVGE